MPSATTKGYPYPLGTDRVMDGDDAIKALAEAIDGDALITKATTVGQSISANVLANTSWNAPNPNGCALTKTSAYLWTVTKPGLYVVWAGVYTTGFAPAGRSYMTLMAGGMTHRNSFSYENTTACTVAGPMIAGDTIQHGVWDIENGNIQANTGWLHVLRLGRT